MCVYFSYLKLKVQTYLLSCEAGRSKNNIEESKSYSLSLTPKPRTNSEATFAFHFTTLYSSNLHFYPLFFFTFTHHPLYFFPQTVTLMHLGLGINQRIDAQISFDHNFVPFITFTFFSNILYA